jgi:hypothetical protein
VAWVVVKMDVQKVMVVVALKMMLMLMVQVT